MEQNEAGTEWKNAEGTGADAPGILPEPVIARERAAHTQGAWEGIKVTPHLLVMYDDGGRLMFVFNSDLGVDMEIPEGIGPIPIGELKPCLAAALDEDSPGVTYFIGGDVGGIKIGRTVNLAVRLKDIQACCPIPVRVLASRQGGAKERMYHRHFAEHRLHGEWFAPHADILAEIERLSPTGEE